MKTLFCSLISIVTGVIITGCEQEQPLQQQSNEVLKVNVRLVGIDSTTSARTENNVLFVNIKK